jgi:phage I-like protein
MIRQSSFEDAILAKLALDLPGTLNPADAPDEIQWMPPGEHEITASRGGKPATLKVNVTAATADRIAGVHRGYVDAAASGSEDLPYLDFNHDDAEASGHPTAFRWGGDDPQQGGVRAKVTWTDSGHRAVVGKSYRRFSPSFYVNDSGDVTGAPVNMGGLVNRAAFKRIAPIVAKYTEFVVLASPQQSFLAKASSVARARNMKLADAIEIAAHSQPYSYAEYRASLGLGDKNELAEAKAAASKNGPVVDHFLIEALRLADQEGVVMAEACELLAHRKPALYDRYCCRMYGREPEPSRHNRIPVFGEGDSAFEQRVKIIAAERGLQTEDAASAVARETPDLYEAYRAAL